MTQSNKSGVSVVEVALAVAILGIISGLAVVGARFYSSTFHQQSAMAMQQQAEVLVYGIEREIRNSTAFPIVAPDTLQLVSYDLSHGFDTNVVSTLFTPANVSTVTYQIMTSGPDRYLSRKIVFKGVTSEKRLLTNQLGAYDNFSNLLSTSVPAGTNPPNVRGVRFWIRLKGFGLEKAVTYTGEAMTRSSSQ